MRICSFVLALLLSLWVSGAQSAPVGLYPDQALSNGGAPGNSVTGVLFRVNREVVIDSISTYINADPSYVQYPYSRYSGFLRLYQSDTIGGLVGRCCTLTSSWSFQPNGVGWYTNQISKLTLLPGIYTLRFSLQGGGPRYDYFGQSENGILPFVSNGGWFTVLDGSTNNAGGIYNDYSTTMLPTFALGVVSSVPLPPAAGMLLAGLLLLRIGSRAARR